MHKKLLKILKYDGGLVLKQMCNESEIHSYACVFRVDRTNYFGDTVEMICKKPL